MESEKKLPLTRREQEIKAHEALMKRLDKMTADERLQTLINVGIVNHKHELTKRYGGPGENDAA